MLTMLFIIATKAGLSDLTAFANIMQTVLLVYAYS
jgi:hypothetical protein